MCGDRGGVGHRSVTLAAGCGRGGRRIGSSGGRSAAVDGEERTSSTHCGREGPGPVVGDSGTDVEPGVGGGEEGFEEEGGRVGYMDEVMGGDVGTRMYSVERGIR